MRRSSNENFIVNKPSVNSVLLVQSLRGLRKFLDDGATSKQHLTKQILTTKWLMSLRSPTEDENGGIPLTSPPDPKFSKELTKATKDSDIFN